MANTNTLVPGPMGISGPNVVGVFAEENWKITGDGSSPTVVITPQWMRRIDAVIAAAAILNTVIDNTVRTVTITLTGNLGNGSVIYVTVRGSGI
jgi:hypothetical protein